MVVEELLESFVGVVDAQLLKLVDGEDLKAGNIKYADEEVFASLENGALVEKDLLQLYCLISNHNSGSICEVNVSLSDLPWCPVSC